MECKKGIKIMTLQNKAGQYVIDYFTVPKELTLV